MRRVYGSTMMRVRRFSSGADTLKGLGIVGVRREDKNKWERRAPLAPEHVKTLVEDGVQVLVQPR